MNFSDEQKSASVLNYVGYDLKLLDQLASTVEAARKQPSTMPAAMDEIFEYLFQRK